MATAIAIAGACATPPPPFAGEWALVAVNDAPLPGVIADRGDTVHAVTHGRLTLFADRTYHDTLAVRVTDPSGVRLTGRGERGRYGFFGSDTIVFDPDGGRRRLGRFAPDHIVRSDSSATLRYEKR